MPYYDSLEAALGHVHEKSEESSQLFEAHLLQATEMAAVSKELVETLGLDGVERDHGLSSAQFLGAMTRLLEMAANGSKLEQMRILSGLRLHFSPMSIGPRQDGGVSLRHDWVW